MSYQPKSHRKFLTTSLTAAMVAGAVAPAAVSAATADFSDLTGEYYDEAIKELASNGHINGYDDGSFKPENQINRAEAATVLTSVHELSVSGDINYSDVDSSDWFSDEVRAVSNAGIFQGYNGAFNPETKLTRQEAATIIVNSFGLQGEGEATTFTDIAGEWGEDFIKVAAENGVIAGYDAQTFAPNDNIKRGDFAVMINRAVKATSDSKVAVESVTAVDATNISVTFANGEETTISLDQQLTKGTNQVSFEYNGSTYTDVEVVYEVKSGVAGFVLDSGDAVEGAVVTVDGETATTDKNGYYEISNVAAGTQNVTIEADGYETNTVSDVEVLENKVSTITEDISEEVINTDLINVSGNIVDRSTGAALNPTVTLESYNAEEDTWVEVASVVAESGAYTIDQATASDALELGAEYRQTVSLSGYHDLVQTITLDDQEVVNTLSGIQLTEIATMDVTGTVTDADGEVVASASVTINNADGEEVASVQTDAEGTYSVEGAQLTDGTYNVVVDDSSSAVSYTEFTVEEGSNATHNVQLEAGYNVNATIGTESLNDVFGADDADNATYSLQLVSGNTVIDTQEYKNPTGQNDSTIPFDFSRVAPGEYTLELSGDYVVSEEFTVTVDGNETIEERALPAGTLTGVVEDSGNTSIEAATVDLLDASGNIVDTAETDASGNYTFVGIPAGDYTVEASADTYVKGSIADTVTVDKNQNVSTGTTLTLDAVDTTGDVSGYIRESGSLAPVDQATVVYYDADGEEVYNTTTNSNGYYTLTNVDAGSYDVVVRDADDGVETFTTTQTVEGGDELTAVNYNLTSGGDASLEISVVDNEGNPVDVAANGFDLADAFVTDETTPAFGTWEKASAAGDTVTFSDLSAGAYDLTIDVASADYVDVETTATLAAGETGELEIVVDKVAAQSSVNYRVVNETNNDVTDADVVVFNEDGTINQVIKSNEDLNLVDGNYTLAVYQNGYVVSENDITVAGEDVTVPVIQLTPFK